MHRLQPVPRATARAPTRPQGGVKWRQDECHMCLNCETACPEDVIKFRFLPEPQERRSASPTLQRRTLLATDRRRRRASSRSRASPTRSTSNYHSKVIRPPGAVEERAFLERCIRCAECMKVCPNNALHPGDVRGRHRGALDADPHRAHRLLRALVRALRPGLPDGRDPEDHREGEARASACRR